MEVYKKLLEVQKQIKVPKNQYNAFGKYSYRSCEDILESLKPIQKEVNTVTIISDAVVQIGDRFYVEATAQFIDTETGESVTNKAYAREEETKKGQDGSQITGSASSYARKYALNGLFCLDDVKDADTTNIHNKNVNGKQLSQKPQQPKPKPTNNQTYKCADCQAEIKQAVSTYSQKHYGRELCRDCQEKQKGA